MSLVGTRPPTVDEWDESETDFNDLYDILFLKNNDFYKIFNVQTEQIENIMEDKEVMERHKLVN